MKRFLSVTVLVVAMFTGLAIPALAHGGEEEEVFNAEEFIRQAIVTIVQPQPNIGVLAAKLTEVIDNKENASGVDVAKVEEAFELIKQENYEEAEILLYASIGEDPAGENNLGSPLSEYEKEFSPDRAAYLLLGSAIVFIGLGGLILKQQKGRR